MAPHIAGDETPLFRTPTRPEVVAVARKVWGGENKDLSTLIEFWWGPDREQGVSLNLKTYWWTDRKGEKAGNVIDLYALAGVALPAGTKPRGKPAWIDACQVNKSADPYPNLFNAALALDGDPDFAGRLGFDEMLCQPVILKAIPGVAPDNCPVEDEQLVALHHALQAKGMPKMSLETLHEAVRHVAYRNKFHPLKERLDRLEADGVPRMGNWLATYLGTEDNEYYRAIGSCFLVGMIQRIYEPGCQMDYMLVLEGPQGTLKSSAIAVLGGPYYSDHLPDLGSDAIRVSQHLRGKWVIEVSELSAFSRAEASKLKSFITQRVERYTPKYARTEVREPRQCVFIGTTNKKLYLRDETGGRRFWPVKCGAIDIDGLRRDLDLLLAEAKEAYQSGTQAYPDAEFERTTIVPIQAERYENDPWEEKMRTYFARNITTSTTILEIAHTVLEFDRVAKIGKADQNRIVACLEALGWERGKRQNFGWPWYAPSNKLL